jgi:hypothetical protein
VTKSFDQWLKVRSGENAMAIAYHPGTVKTGLSKELWGSVKEGKLFEPEFAVGRMMEVARGKGTGDGGDNEDINKHSNYLYMSKPRTQAGPVSSLSSQLPNSSKSNRQQSFPNHISTFGHGQHLHIRK